MSDKKFPTPEEIQKEFEDFVKNRFGGSVQVVSQPLGGPAGTEAPSLNLTDDSEKNETANETLINFNYTPKEIKAHLDRYVIKQDDAKKALAIAVADHYNYVKECQANADNEEPLEYAKQNVLLLGPTGVGKSYLIKHIAKLIGVPFVKADATRFTEMGYVGGNADDLIRDLVSQAGGDIETAQFGIVYLDEADKLAGSPSAFGKDVSGRGTQFSFLKLMEETEIDLRSGNDMASQMQAFMEIQQKGKLEPKLVNTKHILFIVSGAFTGLDEIIEKRLNKNQIGFQHTESSQDHDPSTAFDSAATEDLIEFGFEPEFVGRLPVRVACHQLSVADLHEVLSQSEGSIIRQYVRSFNSYGIKAEFTDDALTAIAELAYQQKTGARALMTVCEKLFRDFKFELPSLGVEHLVINRELVEHPDAYLKKIISGITASTPLSAKRDIVQYSDAFKTNHGMTITFELEAIAALYKIAETQHRPLKDICEETFRSYEHGLKLIQQNTGQCEFNVTEEIVANPRAALEKWITESYLVSAAQPIPQETTIESTPEAH